MSVRELLRAAPPVEKVDFVRLAEVVRWVDGDTVELQVDLAFRMSTRQRFRLYGVDTPERGEPGYHEAAELCRRLLPPGCPVIVRSLRDPDSFDRWLAIIWAADEPTAISHNEQLLLVGAAHEYTGKTRQPWHVWPDPERPS